MCKDYFTLGPFKEFSYVYKKPVPVFLIEERKKDMLITYIVYVKWKKRRTRL